MHTVINHVSTNIEKYRIKAGLTKQELADQAGVTIDTLDNETMSLDDLHPIAKVLKTKVALFFNNPELSIFPTHELICELSCRDGVCSTAFRSIAWGDQS